MNTITIIRQFAMMGCLLTVLTSNAQQNVQFTQYIFNAISVNPAYAGYKEEWFGQMGLRSQWAGWEGAPKSGTISVDGVLDPRYKRHGVGLQLTADALGAQTATSMFLNYALRLQMDRADTHRLAFGIAGGVTQYGLDGSKLDLIDPNDQAVPPGMISTWNPDLRLGVYYYNPRWYLGVAIHDLFSNANSNSDFRFNENSLESLYRNVNLYLISGALFELQPDFHLRPSILVKDDFRGPTTLDLNALFIFDERFWIGAGYRTRARIFDREYFSQSATKLSALNSVQGIAQVYVNPRLRIGYSYDLMVNSMSTHQGGTHEFTLGVTFGMRRSHRMINPRYF